MCVMDEIKNIPVVLSILQHFTQAGEICGYEYHLWMTKIIVIINCTLCYHTQVRTPTKTQYTYIQNTHLLLSLPWVARHIRKFQVSPCGIITIQQNHLRYSPGKNVRVTINIIHVANYFMHTKSSNSFDSNNSRVLSIATTQVKLWIVTWGFICGKYLMSGWMIHLVYL